MPNDPLPADPRLQRRRPADAELDRMTSAEAMQNVADEAERIWDATSKLPGLLSAEVEDE